MTKSNPLHHENKPRNGVVLPQPDKEHLKNHKAKNLEQIHKR